MVISVQTELFLSSRMLENALDSYKTWISQQTNCLSRDVTDQINTCAEVRLLLEKEQN